ncbi:hypothetical protein B0I35DRAFT_151623 [Stachybotrys elegans]|uniref:Zn(2)-C6 fungal-type domain-containing protein n=1 Tax=Stachybotrys elegans TaxID=80388 RepID=A0A8K0SIL6_9HYPO|nr:hypothetical protein B0I35DRAFT_151623 [Stachybotrys elegans]
MPPRGQRSHVKTGCQTCKVRRVKCDEARPICLKCTHSGRICSGYGVWGGGSFHAPINVNDLSNHHRTTALGRYNTGLELVNKTDEEKRAFEFFCRSPSLKISGMFKSKFWDLLLVQLSLSEPVVFHALVAIGSSFRGSRAKEPLAVQRDDRLSLQSYNRAIQQIGHLLKQRDPHSIRVAAVTCILFICIEMLRRRQTMVAKHYHYGLELLQEVQKQRQPIDKLITDAFSRITMHLNLLGQTSQTLYGIPSLPGPIPVLRSNDTFPTLDSAKDALEHLWTSVFELQGQAEQIGLEKTSVPPDLVRRQTNLRVQLSTWKDMFHESMRTTLANPTAMELIKSRMLRSYHIMAGIVLGQCLSGREIAYDAFTPDFAAMLSQVIETLRLSGCYGVFQPGQPKICDADGSFSLEMGGYPTIYFIAMKCRVPRLRRQAIRLLRGARHNEGIATGPILYQIACKIMSLEDPNNTASGFGGSGMVSDTGPSEALVPEESRFHNVKIALSLDETGGTAELTCTKYRSGATPGWETTKHSIDLAIGPKFEGLPNI